MLEERETAKKIYGFGLVGCGAVAAMHLEVIKRLPNARLIGVCDKDPTRAAEFAARMDAVAYPDIDALLSSHEIDVAIICTPSGMHAEQCVRALYAGCHVLVEKPLSLTAEGIAAVEKAAKETGRTVAVVSQQRFSPAIQKIRALIDAGKLGKLLLADLSMIYHRDPSYYEQVPWRGTKAMDGGELFNQGVHGVDLLLYLCGDAVAVAGATRTLTHSIEAEDTTVAMLEFAGGAVGTLRSTTAATIGYPRRMSLYFSGGTVHLDDDLIALWDVPGVEKPEITVDTARQAHRDPMAFSCDYHLAETADLLDALDNCREPLLGLSEGKRAPEVILAIYRAAETGERVTL